MDSRRTTATDSLRSSRSVACSCCAPLRGTWRAFDSWLITRVAILGIKITFYPGMRRSIFLRLRCLLHFFNFFFAYLLATAILQTIRAAILQYAMVSGAPGLRCLHGVSLAYRNSCEKHHAAGVSSRMEGNGAQDISQGTEKEDKKLLQTQQTPVSKRKKNSHHKPGQPLQKDFHQKEPFDDESNFMACDSARFWLEIVENTGWKNFGM
jgi:hypothetical protein